MANSVGRRRSAAVARVVVRRRGLAGAATCRSDPGTSLQHTNLVTEGTSRRYQRPTAATSRACHDAADGVPAGPGHVPLARLARPPRTASLASSILLPVWFACCDRARALLGTDDRRGHPHLLPWFRGSWLAGGAPGQSSPATRSPTARTSTTTRRCPRRPCCSPAHLAAGGHRRRSRRRTQRGGGRVRRPFLGAALVVVAVPAPPLEGVWAGNPQRSCWPSCCPAARRPSQSHRRSRRTWACHRSSRVDCGRSSARSRSVSSRSSSRPICGARSSISPRSSASA